MNPPSAILGRGVRGKVCRLIAYIVYTYYYHTVSNNKSLSIVFNVILHNMDVYKFESILQLFIYLVLT